MLKSRENWVELILQLTCLYVMVAGGCMIRIQGQVAVPLELDMMMLPLVAILYWMRRLFPTFFTNMILADEINRATPKAQSALIECIEEHQVTVDGETRVLDAPFMVIATENPIEQTGTFPLPEAQLDRFLIKVSMGYPDKEEELEIVDKFLLDSPINHLGQVCSREEVLHMIQEAKQVKVDDQIRQLAVQLVEMTRSSQTIEIGASPRATLALMRAIRSYAYIHGRNTCCAEDVKAMAVSVLAHRIKLKPMNLAGTKSQEAVIEQLVAELFA